MKRIIPVPLGILLAVAGFASGVYLASGNPFRIEVEHSGSGTITVFRPEIIGFFPYWLLERSAPEQFGAITTFTYFGLTVGPDGHVVRQVNPREEEPGWTTLRLPKLTDRLKETERTGIKRSLLIHASDEQTIADLIRNPELHADNLVSDIEPLMTEGEFTDLNIDIESFREASESAREMATALIGGIAQGMRDRNLGTVTVELAPRALIKPLLLDPARIAPIADTVVLMTYDYHYAGSFVSGPVAPIDGGGIRYEFDVRQAVTEAVKVIPKEKLILGIPFYGYEWDTITDTPGDPTIPGTGKTASSRRVSELLTNCPECAGTWDPVSRSPYAILQSENGEYFRQLYYENEESVRQKIDIARKLELKGIAIWAFGYEDGNVLKPVTEYRNFRRVTLF